jgi:hypothetical protein
MRANVRPKDLELFEDLAAEKLAPATLVYGRVLDLTPLVGLLMEQLGASAQAEASSRTKKRVEALHGSDSIAPARDVEAAKAQAVRDQAALESVQLRIRMTWGAWFTNAQNTAELVDALAASRAALVRLDAPLDFEAAPPHTRLALGTAALPSFEAKYLTRLPATDAQLQTLGLIYLVGDPTPPAGTGVVAWLDRGGAPLEGVVVPRSALLRYEGLPWVYVRTAPDVLARRPIELVRAMPKGWFVTSGVRPGDTVVTTGAQQLLSAEVGRPVDD